MIVKVTVKKKQITVTITHVKIFLWLTDGSGGFVYERMYEYGSWHHYN